jgi:hypothetical protein
MQAVIASVVPDIGDWNAGAGNRTYSAFCGHNLGTYEAKYGYRLVSIPGDFYYGISMNEANIIYAGISMARSTAGSIIDYDTNDYTCFENNTYKWVVGGTTVTSISSGGIAVTGNITATGNCCVDYVFEDNYDLMELDKLDAFIENTNHLPNITIGQNDKVDLINSVSQLLEKTEEQALYILQLHQRLKALENYAH